MSTWSSLLKPPRRTAYWLLLAGFFATLGLAFAALLLGVAGWLIAASAMAGIGMIAIIDIFAPGAAIRAFAVGRTVARYLERLIGHEATLRQLTELRVSTFQNLLRLPPRDLDALGKGDTLTRLTSDIDTLDHLIPKLVLPTAAAVVVTLLAVIGYGVLDIRLGLIVLITFGLFIPCALFIASRYSRGPGRALANIRPILRAQLSECIGGIKALKTIGQTGPAFDRVQRHAHRLLAQQLTLRKVEALTHGAIATAGFAAVWLLLLGALQLSEAEALPAPWVILIVLSSLALVDAWIPLANGWSFVETCRRAAERLDQLAPNDCDDDETEHANETMPVDFEHGSPRSLQSQSLGFRYQAWGEPILENCSLSVESGQTVVINGDSGCGKSTLGQLLAGLLAPTEGKVLFGGKDICTMPVAQRRSSIGYLPQQPVLFHDTLRSNLQLANAQASEADMLAVIEQVQMTEFLRQLPDGLDSWIGEHGQSVSGGEARRLALARLMLADHAVLILDEPTAGLDRATAAYVSSAIELWTQTRSLVILTHDVQNIPAFDQMYTLVSGRLDRHQDG